MANAWGTSFVSSERSAVNVVDQPTIRVWVYDLPSDAIGDLWRDAFSASTE
jgi:hypothetical protein